jgi:hypothetical protein
MRISEKIYPKTPPKKWFAWYPVYARNESKIDIGNTFSLVWMEYVMREGTGASFAKWRYCTID